MDKTVYTVLLLFFVLVAAPVPSSRAADATVQAQNAQAADKLKKEKPASGKMQKAPVASSRQLPVKKQKNSLHARDWTFSEGSSRDAWQIQGMPTNNLQGRAVGSPVPKNITPGQVVTPPRASTAP